MKAVVAIVGPTGVGKSRLALALAGRFPAEIVNADSRQVCRFLDIGTAKPSEEDRCRVPHHLIDIVDPDKPFSLALYQQRALGAIQGIHQKGKVALLVGGTGLYVWSVLEGYQIPGAIPDADLRQTLQERALREGTASLYQELQKVDPEAAAAIAPTNVRRIIRALEVFVNSGRPFSAQQQRQPPPFRRFILGLTLPREELYRRIDERVDAMVAQGWVAEVRQFLERGYSPDLPALTSVGYRQVCAFLRGELSLVETVRRIKVESHRLARRQYAWFRLNDPRIHWLDASQDPQGRASTLVAAFLSGDFVDSKADSSVCPV